MRKRLISVILTVVLLCSMGMGTHAMNANTQSDTEIQPLLNYTSVTSALLTITDGRAICYADVIGYEGVTTKITIEMTLQKKTLWWWDDVQSWKLTNYDYIASDEESVNVSSGTYRVKAVFTIYSGTASETVTDYSPEKSC